MPSQDVLTRLVGLSRFVQRARTRDIAYAEIFGATQAATGADFVVFFTLTKSDTFEVERDTGHHAYRADLLEACREAAEATFERHDARSKQAAEAGRPVRNPGTSDGPPVKAAATLVMSGKEVLGALAIARTGAEPFSERALGFLRSAGDQSGVGFANQFTDPPRPDPLEGDARDAPVDEEARGLGTRVIMRPQIDAVRAAASTLFVGAGPAYERVLERIARCARSEITVLIRGETGTGKEVVARLIHECSERREGPLVVTNPSEAPPTLFEAQMFGHTKGAYTGATETVEGVIPRADGGTLFIDEIGDFALDLQVKLLRVIQEKEVPTVGKNAPTAVDFRLIAATNAPLEELVAEGMFRKDLFFRIKTFQIDLPPLREQKESIPLLVRHFLEKCHSTAVLTKEAMDRLLAHSWPGNTRELESVIETAVMLTQGRSKIEARHIEIHPLEPTPKKSWTPEDARRALDAAKGNKSEAARKLEIDRKTLNKLLERS